MCKSLVCKEEEIKCNNIIKQYRNVVKGDREVFFQPNLCQAG